jgi:hypothetical protein
VDVIMGMAGKGFVRVANVSVGSGEISTGGDLFNEDSGVGESGVSSADGGREDSVTSATDCNFEFPEAGLSPETVVALDNRTFCPRLGCEPCMIPDKDVGLGGRPGMRAAESDGMTVALGDPPAELAVQSGLKAFGVSGKVW